MGDDETVGEIVEPEVEDVKSDAWRHLKKIFISSGTWRKFLKNEATDQKGQTQKSSQKPLALYN